MDQHGGRCSAAGSAGVVAAVPADGPGDQERAGGAGGGLLVLQTHPAAGRVEVENPAAPVPLYVGRRLREQVDGARQADGAAGLHEHRLLAQDHSRGS